MDLDDVRGGTDVVTWLEKTIRLAEGTPTCQVLAAHKGSGKSTERPIRELLTSRAVLQYDNGEEWYGLNPMVAALKPPC